MSDPPPGPLGSSALGADWLDRQRFDSVAEECGWSRLQLAEFYVEGVRDQLSEMRGALQAGSAQALQRLAHGCVGSSATCGVRVMSERFRALELAAEDGGPGGAAEALERAERTFERVAAALAEG